MTEIRSVKRHRTRRALLFLVLAAALLIAVLRFADGAVIKRLKLELHASDYSDSLLTLGRSNPDALDFVLGWPEAKDGIYRAAELDLSEDLRKAGGKLPLLLQWDSRWGYAPYGSNIMGLAGCGPTCLSMVTAGLTGNTAANPLAVADYSVSQGWYVPGAGTDWELMRSGAAHYGLHWREISADRETMLSALDAGEVLIANMLPGDFTSSGHFIVISGYESSGFQVLDPNSPTRSEKLWGYSEIKDQIAVLWAYAA